MTEVLDIRLLGEFCVRYDDTPVTAVNSSRLQSLLAYLVLNRHAPQSRHAIAFLLWPDSNETQALSNLRNLLHRLRQALPLADDFIDANARTVQWKPDSAFVLDVADFENGVLEAASLGALQKAVERYGGNLLPGCYEEWILAERERLRQRFIGALERLSQLLEENRDYQTSIQYVQQLLRHKPTHEGAYRQLMRLNVQTGNRAGAFRVFHDCVTVLHRELSVDPDPATYQLYDSLLNLDALPSRDTRPPIEQSAQSPLMGRAQEWAQLMDCWQRATRGQPWFVSISGEVGIGKTRLAEELLAWGGRQEIVTARTRAYAAEGRLAYAPVIGWLRTSGWQAELLTLDDIWLIEVTRLLPELLIERPDLPQPGFLVENWQRLRLFEALARAVFIVACNQPLLLQIDDLQWCDRETLEWLHYLLRFEQKTPLLVVGTFRPEEVGPEHPLTSLLLDLRRRQQLTEIELGPLDSSATTLLAAHIIGQHPDSVQAAHLYQETEGNPLFVIEMVRAGALNQRVSLSHGDHKSDRQLLVLPPTVQAVISGRLAKLSPPTHELVRVAATIGRDFTVDILARTSGESEEMLLRQLDELWQRRIIHEHDVAAYDFSHDKIREVAYAELSLHQRQVIHRRVAQALETVFKSNVDAVSGQVATHYEHAGLTEKALSYYQRAAEAARRVYANEETIHAFQRALDLIKTASYVDCADSSLEDDPASVSSAAVAAPLHEGLGDVFTRTGQYAKARAALRSALTQTSDHNRVSKSRLYRKLGKTWESRDELDAALHAYELAESALGRTPVEADAAWWQEWAQIHLERLTTLYFLDRWRQMAVLVERTRPLVERYGTPSQQAQFLQSIVQLACGRDRYVISSETLTIAHKQLDILRKDGDPSEVAWARFLLAFVLLWHGEFVQSVAQLHAALTSAEQIGDPVLKSRCLNYLVVAYRKMNEMEEATQYVSRSLEAATTAELTQYIGMAKANLAWIEWRKGDLDKAAKYAQAALTAWQQRPVIFPFEWSALWPLIGVTFACGQYSQSMAYAGALLEPSQQPLPTVLETAVIEAKRFWDSGQQSRAKAQLDRAMASARDEGYL